MQIRFSRYQARLLQAYVSWVGQCGRVLTQKHAPSLGYSCQPRRSNPVHSGSDAHRTLQSSTVPPVQPYGVPSARSGPSSLCTVLLCCSPQKLLPIITFFFCFFKLFVVVCFTPSACATCMTSRKLCAMASRKPFTKTLRVCVLSRPPVRSNASSLMMAAGSAPSFGLQHAMTSSEERTSAEAEGYRIERSLMDCVAPPFHNPSVSSSRFLVAKGDFRPACTSTRLLK